MPGACRFPASSSHQPRAVRRVVIETQIGRCPLPGQPQFGAYPATMHRRRSRRAGSVRVIVVVVVIPAVTRIQAVQRHTQKIDAGLPQFARGLGQACSRCVACVHHQQHAVHMPRQHNRICHGQNWRAIEKHDIRAAAKSETKCSMRCEPNNSEGLGGIGPLVNTRQGFDLGRLHIAFSDTFSPASSEVVRPMLLGTPKTLCSTGRRRSVSTTITRWPVCASTTARLAVVVLLPSPGPELVTNRLRTGLSTLENWMFVRNVR